MTILNWIGLLKRVSLKAWKIKKVAKLINYSKNITVLTIEKIMIKSSAFHHLTY
ncbi:hypothetical protein J2T03_000131 [Chryseobacterium lathyri]|nr:hypothetical protein [Chryseobacterium lathyri]